MGGWFDVSSVLMLIVVFVCLRWVCCLRQCQVDQQQQQQQPLLVPLLLLLLLLLLVWLLLHLVHQPLWVLLQQLQLLTSNIRHYGEMIGYGRQVWDDAVQTSVSPRQSGSQEPRGQLSVSLAVTLILACSQNFLCWTEA